MPVFMSEHAPQRVVITEGRGVVARFRGGRFVTDDESVAAVLGRVPGVEQLDEQPGARAVAAVSPPALRGPRSGTSVWRAYATEQGVVVSDDMDRAAIIAACRTAGVA